jgi:NADH-quinone oxidoreductase subunit E
MSMFSFPADMNMSEMMKPMNVMTNWTRADEMPVSPLMVYPLGAAAAATAIGFGMAGQMSGLMMGTMQAMIEGQKSLSGARPDLSWMMPVLAEDLAPDEARDADSPQATESQSAADIVELKPAAKAAEAALGRAPDADAGKKPSTAKQPTKAKAPARKPSAPKAASSADGSVATVEKLKSDADAAAAAAREAVPAKAKDAPGLEPEDYRRPSEIERPETPDDLKLISGVGPKLEQVLNGLGVWTYAQIADWKAEEVAWVDDYLQFKGRIDRDDWVSQARTLAKGGQTA